MSRQHLALTSTILGTDPRTRRERAVGRSAVAAFATCHDRTCAVVSVGYTLLQDLVRRPAEYQERGRGGPPPLGRELRSC
ncbi:hypothetical protein [Streptomyces sp. NPDC049040]|uniref:hypothetical protein n=1 Tax=Streptomyces sp. NPDC049040 TaxID=3365593 RepID=UPI003712EC0C